MCFKPDTYNQVSWYLVDHEVKEEATRMNRLEPNVLKNLPIIPSQTSQNFYPFSFSSHNTYQLFLFYSIVSMIISQCRSDYILFTQQIMFTDCFNRIVDCSIRVSRSFANQVAVHSKHLGGPGPCQACLLVTPLFETTVSRVSHVSAILVSDYSCFVLVHSL